MTAGANRHDVAIVTASYAGDFERCRLLCETVDRHVGGFSRHLILVADHDAALFRTLESGNRSVVAESDLLPPWMHVIRDPASLFARHLWLSFRTRPLRGWHVQQLRRIAVAKAVDEAALFFCDSDVVFVRPFECGSLWHGNELRFLCRPNALDAEHLDEQRRWSQNAAAAVPCRSESPRADTAPQTSR